MPAGATERLQVALPRHENPFTGLRMPAYYFQQLLPQQSYPFSGPGGKIYTGFAATRVPMKRFAQEINLVVYSDHWQSGREAAEYRSILRRNAFSAIYEQQHQVCLCHGGTGTSNSFFLDRIFGF